MSLFSKIRGTIETLFQIGLQGPQLKKSSGAALDVRDNADGAYAVVRVAAPVGGQDAATKTYTDTGDAASVATSEAYTDAAVAGISTAGVVREIRMPLALAATTTSATSIPANAVVNYVAVKVGTQYSAGATVSVGQTGSLALLMATVDNLPQSTDMFEISCDIPWGASALPVVATIAGAPAAGAGFVIVRYTVPNT